MIKILILIGFVFEGLLVVLLVMVLICVAVWSTADDLKIAITRKTKKRRNQEPEELTDEEAEWKFQDRMDQAGKEELHREEETKREAQDDRM